LGVQHGPLGLLRTRLRRPGDNGPCQLVKIKHRKVRVDGPGWDIGYRIWDIGYRRWEMGGCPSRMARSFRDKIPYPLKSGDAIVRIKDSIA